METWGFQIRDLQISSEKSLNIRNYQGHSEGVQDFQNSDFHWKVQIVLATNVVSCFP